MPKINFDDTIAAIATPVGEGGIAVIRVSGPEAISACEKIFHAKSGRTLSGSKALRVMHGHIVDIDGTPIDEVLVTCFRAPKSYTGEDVVEISSHGGMVITRKILNLFFRHGVRPAEPGEFTRRAFLNGRLDLAQAEAVLDVIRAKTDAGLRVAEEQLAGRLSGEIRRLKEELVKVYAHIEAFVDFPEEDIEVFSQDEILKRLEAVTNQIQTLIASYQKGEVMREGVLAVIVGRPNVGKSSLLNALLDRDRAIVSEIPGTTRDALEERIELGGILFRLVDTAGLGQAKDSLDKLAGERTRKFLNKGEIFLFVLDGSAPFQKEDQAIQDLLSGKRVIPVINKSDLVRQLQWQGPEPVAISAKTRDGLSQLEERLLQTVCTERVSVEGVMVTRLRHKVALERARESLESAKTVFRKKESLEFLSFDIKSALDQLAELIGEVSSEDLLDVIFSEFCIGK